MKELTAEQKDQYLAKGGVECPACGSNDIEGHSVTINEARAFQTVHCHVCDAEWMDTYALTSVQLV